MCYLFSNNFINQIEFRLFYLELLLSFNFYLLSKAMRYFLEVSYKGTNYSGFQSQENANTVQAEVERAFAVLQREGVVMTGSP